MALAVYGETGLGKTYNMYYTLKGMGRRVLLIRSLEQLDRLKRDHTDIIFDDISFEFARPELLIHLCDKDFPAPIRILRKSITIPQSVNKWFTHNNIEAWTPILATVEQQAAINRRLQIVKVNNRDQIIQLCQETISTQDHGHKTMDSVQS